MIIRENIVIIGSGPAGVSAAFPLLNKGHKVLMIDVGNTGESLINPGDSLSNLRRSDRQSDIFVGKNFEVINSLELPSPKIRAPTNRYVFEDYHEKYKIIENKFRVSGSLAAGGLSNAWGAGVSCFDDNDLEDFPFKFKSLEESYRHISNRIGVSGEHDDMGNFHGFFPNLQKPLCMDKLSERLLFRYNKNPNAAHSNKIKIGRTRHAVISNSFKGRSECNSCGLCLWGCPNKSIYSSLYDLDALKKLKNFTYKDGLFTKQIVKNKNGYDLICNQENEPLDISISAKKVVLACGTIGSAKLVLDALGIYNQNIKILTAPSIAFAMFMPGNFGLALDDKIFSMGQLSFRVDDEKSPEGYAFGSTLPANTILASEFIKRTPLSYPLSRNVIRIMQSSILLGNCFFSSSYGEHTMCLGKDDTVLLQGNYKDMLNKSIKGVRKKIIRMMRSYNFFEMPGGFKIGHPGDDIHYAGTLPMKKNPRKYETTPEGEVAGLPGIFVVDGSVLSSLPPKSHTYTIMANANRIGSICAKIF